MKMIDVLTKLANGGIEDKSTLLVESEVGETFEYVYYERYCFFRGQCCSTLEDDFGIDKDFLNYEVELIPPKPKKYYLRLDEDDNLSYINYNKEEYFCFMIASKYETLKSQSKFTQEEIDGSMLLKFIEQHGIKEEVEDNEND